MSPQSATPWFRFYSEVLSDRKIKRVAAMTNQPPVVVIGLWSIILMMANDSPERGKLLITQGVPVSVEEIADTAGIDSAGCNAILEAFTSLNMMFLDDNGVLTVTQWNTRQFTSDISTERVKRFRDRQKQGGEKGGIENNEYTKRSSNVSETPPESDTESESESESLSAPPTPVIPSKKPQDKIASPKEQGLFLILARLCHIDLKTNPLPKQIGQLDDTVKALLPAIKDCTFFAVKFETYWTTVDWRGKQGQPPTPPQIREVYGDYCHWLEHGEKRVTAPNGQTPPPPKPITLTPEQMAAARALNNDHQAAVAETTQRVNGLLAAGVTVAGVDVDRELRKPMKRGEAA